MNLATKQTLGSLDVSKIRRLIVVRRSRAVRTVKSRDDIKHFISNHLLDQIEQEEDGKLCSVRPGSDYLSLVVNIDVYGSGK